MMRAYEIWQHISPKLNHEILESAYLNHKKLYRHIVEEMAANLRVRSQKLLETPRAERHIQFAPFLGLPHFNIISQNLLMDWLLKSRSEILVDFLDALGIQHDGHGQVEEFPEKMDSAKLKSAVEGLYGKHDEESVNVYLNVFNTVAGESWPELSSMIHPFAKKEESSTAS